MIYFDEDLVKFYVEDKLRENILGITSTHEGFRFRCPVCGDSKKSKRKARGNYYKKTCTYHCFNEESCGCSGLNIISKLCDIPYKEVLRDYLIYIKTFSSKSTQSKLTEEPSVAQPIKKNISSIPDYWIPLPKSLTSVIEKRKVLQAPFAPKNWKFYYNTKSKRLVIPWYKNGQLIYCQERAINSSQQPKYIFPSYTDKRLFGIDEIDENYPYIFLLEGCFDSVWVKNGIAIGGFKPTITQTDEMQRYICEPVLFLDNQNVDKTAKKKMLKVAKESPTQKIFVWPKQITEKDVNEYIVKHNNNPFIDYNFLQENISYGLKILAKFKFNS